MLAIFLKTIPFFALIGLGWIAGRRRFMDAQATAALTRFVFYFPLPAMLFGFAATLPVADLFDPAFLAAYILGSLAVWGLVLGVARLRALPGPEAAMEAHTAMTGNTGFLGVPMLVALLGPQAAGPVLMVLTTDMVVFSVLITVIITALRSGRVAVGPLVLGVLRNPLIMAMVLGLLWSELGLPVPQPARDFLSLLGGAATPVALFAIGASLANLEGSHFGPALWLSFAKLVLHPLAVAITALWLFPVERHAAGVMIAAAALPVAGNVYILATYFGVAAHRVSTAILISTGVSIVTIPGVIAWVLQ
ncbi:AEC family transporter [Paenirhodobacter populi]|uniref:AEC family transporter n=1 Tax=Paenirhodobacter populi TaxID=2306993 RepID=UPI000FE4319F|nr:AEC family transporter [Sinirhodobacter populi]RWR08046.1 AEC family transporter [Sinirhodobacter populi]